MKKALFYLALNIMAFSCSKNSKNQFVIASLGPTIYDYAIDKNPTYNYYMVCSNN